MASKKIEGLAGEIIDKYLKILKENNVPLYQVYVYGSFAKGNYNEHSDIDIAIFYDNDDIDIFEEDVKLFKMTKKVDLRIEPHSFKKSDLDEPDPFIDEIIKKGIRII